MRFLLRTLRFGMAMSKFNPKIDYYSLLQLNKQASPEQIKKSFKELAKKYHPDVSKGNEEAFKQVNEAYQILSCP